MGFLSIIIALIGGLVLVREARRDMCEGEVELNIALVLVVICAFLRLWEAQWASLALASGWWTFFFLLACRGGAGSGDGPLVALVGLSLPFFWGLVALASAFVIGGVYGLWGLVTRRFTRHHAVPFVPFLALGYWISLITWLAM